MTLDSQGKQAEAEKHYRAAIASFEVARLRIGTTGFERASYTTKRSYFLLASCLARSKKPEEAWRFAEAGLARGLLDDLSAKTQTLLKPEEQQRLRDRAARLNKLDQFVLPLLTTQKLSADEKARLTKLSKEREKLQADLAREAAERSRGEVFSLPRIQKQVPADAALVFGLDASRDHWACVVRGKGTPTWVRLPGTGDKGTLTDADYRLVARLYKSLFAGEADWSDLASRMAKQRLTPLQPALAATVDLPAVRRLIVVSTGWLGGMPLDTLTKDYVVSYAPSATVFARLREKHRALRELSLLALGDPVFETPVAAKLPPLPEHGLLLKLVLPNGNASKAGLRSGDVLLHYGDTKLTMLADLKLAARGEPVAVKVWRQGQPINAKLQPGQLGAILDREPAPQALRQQRKLDTLLASRTRDKIKALPATRYEVQTIQRLFPQAKVLLGSDASEQKLDEVVAADRLKDFRILHFATHGQINSTTASRSALLLARDRLPDPLEQARRGRKAYNGRLTVATIASSWQLDADLVTLSACETALGPYGGGEGLLGFSQVLLHKGARSLLLSLWKVDDAPTALLMTRFYENLLGKRKDLKAPLPKAEALREAQAWLRALSMKERDQLAASLANGELRSTESAGKPVVRPKEEPVDKPYAHPRYWAAFILLGDPE
jgi:hypothetical protein